MPLFAFEGHEPDVSPEAWIAPTATIVGNVRVEAEASIWYGAVLRADFGPIIVRRGANIQDGSVLHGGAEPITEIGEGATVGHLCVVHGAVVRAEALIGNGSTVLDGAIVGSRALVAAGATVPPGMEIPDGMLAAGVPARIVGELTPGAKRWVETNPSVYRALARRHASSVRPVLAVPPCMKERRWEHVRGEHCRSARNAMSSEHPVRNEPATDLEDEEGGDPVCWAHLVCPECGAITSEGHRAGCESAREVLNLTRRDHQA